MNGFISTFLLVIILFTFKSDPSLEINQIEQYKKAYFKDFDQFISESRELKDLTNQSLSEVSQDLIKNQINATRLAYKRVEFIFDYYETTYNYLNINGGPIPKMHNEVSEIDFVPPNGLQTLDELIFADNFKRHYKEIDSLASELLIALNFIRRSHEQIKLSKRQIIEATRSGLIRNFTLGVTGFDTPGSANDIQETKVSYEAMLFAFEHFESDVPDSLFLSYRQIKLGFSQAIAFLDGNNDFDTFDRLLFLKSFVNPLYRALLQFQISMGIPSKQYKNHAHNYQSKNLFDKDFLNTDFYSEFTYNSLNNNNAITLGKLLFHDPILSKDLYMSCASCHDPKMAFADGMPKSNTNKPGIKTKRNSPTLIDAGFSSRYFWDMREYDLEKQVAHVIHDSNEFNISFPVIIKRLNQSSRYKELFKQAYGGISKNDINSRSISNAIAAYVNTLKSFDSPFDKYVRNEVSEFPIEAKRGFNLFMGKASCGTCHFAPVFNGSVPPYYMDAESEVLGVTQNFDTINPVLDSDRGRYENGLQREAFDHFKNSFKTVTIRNVALTAPYMHNGSFNNLEDVLIFYNKGGGAGMGMDIEHQTLSSIPLNLSVREQSDIISFMHTLTDTAGMTAPIPSLPIFESRPEWDDRVR